MTDTPESAALSTIALLKANSLTQVIQREIERMILSGELAAGERLNENALAAKLSVSRGPIREASRALAELGFVHLIPNRGVFVKSLGRDDAMEVYDVRAGLTGLAGMLLAPVVTKAQLAALDGMLAEMRAASESTDFAGFYALNLHFHQFIIEATGNSRLVRIYQGLVKEFQLFRRHGLVQQDAMAASLDEHRDIVAALRQRDAQACYDASFQHVQNGKQRMLAALDSMAADGTPDSAVATRLG
ncbi:MAG: FCD domain-containing protein [Alphaproteobacteria bacterium]|nr:FCD domain-containing protein [Alphaproteobacteria bacterium]